MTDLHLNFLRPLALDAFYRRVAAEKPDALLVTGDTAEADSLVGFLDGMHAATGAHVYFVLGNHDFYRGSIAGVREMVQKGPRGATWIPGAPPIELAPRTMLVGIDGWGDGRCGDVESKLQLSDWTLIADFERCQYDRAARISLLRMLGDREARRLRETLATVPDETAHLVVLTHVPPMPEACVYDGKQSDPPWLPWFTCIRTGEALREYAAAHPDMWITVLCGHTHGLGVHQALPNLVVRTGGWPPGAPSYGHPAVQATFEY